MTDFLLGDKNVIPKVLSYTLWNLACGTWGGRHIKLNYVKGRKVTFCPKKYTYYYTLIACLLSARNIL